MDEFAQEGLLIETRLNRAVFAGRALELAEPWVRFLGLLGLACVSPEVLGIKAFKDGHCYVHADEVARLEGFTTARTESLRKSLRRFVRDTLPERLDGRSLIVSPGGMTDRMFRLEQVRVEFDVETAAVLGWLNLERAATNEVKPDAVHLVDLAEIEMLCEARRLDQAEHKLLALEASLTSDPLRARCLLIWSFVREQQGRKPEADAFLERAIELIQPQDLQDLMPLAELQTARLARADEDLETAERIVRRLRGHASVAGNPHLLARLELLRGLLHLDSSTESKGPEPRGAEAHFQAALEFSLEAHWWWGTQAACANFGLMWWLQLEWLERDAQNPQAVHAKTLNSYLTRARSWFERAEGLCATTGLRHQSPELLIYQAKVLRRQGDLGLVMPKLEAAMALAREWRHDRSLVEVLLEQAELLWSQSALDLARRLWRDALERASEFAWRDEVLRRIAGRLE
jgi:tetratricopeptide (TPR) repeat protein